MPNIQSSRSLTTGIVRIILLLSAQIPAFRSHPLPLLGSLYTGKDDPEGNPEDPQFWIYMAIACILVLGGGVFAGLTLGLMGQDEIYLQVIEESGEEHEKKNAKKVLRLLKRGKHWVLVTLLLGNVITNETLPIVLDRSLGGGWPAVVASTGLIVIFGEIIPQSVCVRYGLAIGAYLSPFVLGLMYLMYPFAYPISILLDRILGEDHGTTYKKAGLKTLVTLHKTIGQHPSERLNQDEVTIISAVLDLKDKPVGTIMTPMADVFIMSSETVLDEEMMDRILGEGYSRIPIHAPGEPTNFVGMLLVKILITYDPEDAMKVGDFPLATLPETAPETSCLDIVNFFQEGKSHMVLVSKSPGENYGALGVLTLEDVIEELIGEEIIDESDVFIDVHKAIRRLNPSPITRRTMTSHLVPKDQMSDKATNAAANQVASTIATIPENGAAENLLLDLNTRDENAEVARRLSTSDLPDDTRSDSQKMPPSVKRKMSDSKALPPDFITSLKHLGPSNRASAPRLTTSKNVKIKPGVLERSSTMNTPTTPTARRVSFADDAVLPSQVAHNLLDHPPPPPPPSEVITQADLDARSSKPDSAHSSSSSRAASPMETFASAKVRTGSIIERQQEVGGVKKVIVEATSSSDSEESRNGADLMTEGEVQQERQEEAARKKREKNKKKNAKRKGKKNGSGNGDINEEEGEADEGTSLLGGKK